jgi:hypothetical protein
MNLFLPGEFYSDPEKQFAKEFLPLGGIFFGSTPGMGKQLGGERSLRAW